MYRWGFGQGVAAGAPEFWTGTTSRPGGTGRGVGQVCAMGGYFGHFWAVGFIRPSGHTFRPRQRTAFLLRAGRPRGKRGYGLRDKSRSRISAKRSCAAGISTRKSTVDSLALSRSGELCANAACSRPTSESSNKQRMIRRSLLTAESTSARTHSLRMLFWDVTTMNLSHKCSAALTTVLYCLDHQICGYKRYPSPNRS